MAIELQARESVVSLDELRGVRVGEPFAGWILSTRGIKPYFFVRTEEPAGDNYSFLSLPNHDIHQIDVAGRDIDFFDGTMTGRVRPAFNDTKARIATFPETTVEYQALQKRVLDSLEAYHNYLQQLKTGQPQGAA
jgi:hypothetical protein